VPASLKNARYLLAVNLIF